MFKGVKFKFAVKEQNKFRILYSEIMSELDNTPKDDEETINSLIKRYNKCRERENLGNK